MDKRYNSNRKNGNLKRTKGNSSSASQTAVSNSATSSMPAATVNNSSQQSDEKKGNSSKWLMGLAALALVASIAVNAYLFADQRKLEDEVAELKTTEGQQQLANEEVSSITESISRHMLLPADETPAIATVTDAEALKEEQPFFKDAQNDDKIVIYAEAERAILYRPSEDKIINVGPYIQQTEGEVTGTKTDENSEESTTNTAEPTTTSTPSS